jgi:peptide deformylase
MTQLTILTFPDPRLKTRAARVERVDEAVKQLVDDLFETLKASGGIGLAATQVDVHRRVVVIDVPQEPRSPRCLINPEILSSELAAMSEESCLSVPDVVDVVPRQFKVRVRALDRDGQPFEYQAEGLEAACIQHELDHLDGKLFVDKLSCLKRARLERRLSKR